MRFDFTDLRLFLNVQEAGTITGGAESTHMTLASASERIRGMENSLGVPLLTRDRRGVQLTPAGVTLMHHARLVLEQMERMYGELGGYGAGLKGHVRMLCNTSALSEHLPEVLSTFLAIHPGISIDLEERSSQEIVNALRNDVCDLGMVSDSVNVDGLESFIFRADPLVLVVAANHLLSKRTRVSLAEVVGSDFVGLVEGSALQDHVAHHAHQLGRRLSYRIRVRSFDSVCRVVGFGIGIGIVPKTVAVRCSRAFNIKKINLSDVWASRNLILCVRNLEKLPIQARQLVNHVLATASGSSSI